MRLLLVLCSLSILVQAEADCPEAEKCNPDVCKLPECFCSGSETKVESDNIADKPQIVFLTFDDALTDLASKDFYDELFGTPTEHKYSNPNGCAIRATHYITHSYTDYSLVNRWWHYGHEIASHSITHRNNDTYWKGMSEEEWKAEMVGQRRITGQFAAIDPCEISGTRAPFLQGGGDVMYTMLKNNSFTYDCTWPTRAFGYVDAEQGLYPYTLDYKTVQDCPIKPCPKCAQKGLWVQPLIDLEDEWIGANPDMPNNGNPCSMLDACVIFQRDDYTEDDPHQVYDMLMKNFNRTYRGDVDDFNETIAGNKAPWGLYMHAAWFFGENNRWHYEGYKMFIEEITKYDDVWIVPVRSGIDYMQQLFLGYSYSNAGLINAGKDKGPFQCKDIEERTGKYNKAEHRCGPAKKCRFPMVDLPDDNIHGERYMTICSYTNAGTKQTCPEEDRYPWLETTDSNPCGGNMPCEDCPKP